MSVQLLHYRPWRGRLASPLWSVWPIARLALVMMFRRKLFWALYALALFMFFLFYFGQYMLFWAESMITESRIRVGPVNMTPHDLIRLFRDRLKMNGSGETYRNFIGFQGYMSSIVLALAGSILIGNDLRNNSLSFYLSKPLASGHYLAGKFLAVGVFINLLTTIPALVLYVQYGLLDTYDYFGNNAHLLFGILAYGAVLTVVLGLLLIAVSVALRKTVPLILAWMTLFFFCRQLSGALVDRLGYDPRWRLLDLWNNTYLAGNALLGVDLQTLGRQPELVEACVVLGAVCVACLIFLIRRVRAVEIVT